MCPLYVIKKPLGLSTLSANLDNFSHDLMNSSGYGGSVII